MLVTPLPIVTSVTALQYANAPSPIPVTLSGIVRPVIDEQLKNAKSPMFVTVLPNSISSMLLTFGIYVVGSGVAPLGKEPEIVPVMTPSQSGNPLACV